MSEKSQHTTSRGIPWSEVAWNDLPEMAKRGARATALLDLEMPNGKKLRDCTGDEVTGMMERIKGLFAALEGMQRQ